MDRRGWPFRAMPDAWRANVRSRFRGKPVATLGSCPRACFSGSCEGSAKALNTSILLFLLQDGITNGAIYALLGLALVLVFAVTRVILIPQGEFITYGALTYAALATGRTPGTVWLVGMMGLAAFGFELWSLRRSWHPWRL